MLFNQIEFILFFAVSLLFLGLVKNNRLQKLFLLAGSYYFYGYWDWRFLGLIFLLTVINYLAGLLLEKESGPRIRKWTIGVCLFASFSILGFFKYYNFFVDSLNSLFGGSGVRFGSLRVLLPVGISFYTFQTLSYSLDVYRNKLKACRSFSDFSLFVSFFPQLVAGPIVRASDFLPQLESRRTLSKERAYLGFRQFVFGLFKKVFIADKVSFFVDYVFGNVEIWDSATIWIAVLGYAIQIYCDFSGYSDMAIGVARIMGYDFNKNFNHPYNATSITEFWRRWHISLSTWLRDYLYIPLGGNRKGPRRTYINLLITMLLGGLWHGAAWTFVVWGGLHGLALGVHKWFKERGWLDFGMPLGLKHFLGWALTMLVVLVGWVLFRSESFADAIIVYQKMFTPCDGVSWYYPFALGAVVFLAVSHGIHLFPWGRFVYLPAHRWYTPIILFILIMLVIGYYPKSFTPFIYFQF